MRPVVVDGDVTMAFDPLGAAGLVAVCVVLLLVGLVSQGYLRPMGNLPRMRELVWGARWFGPIMVGALALYVIALYVGIVYSNHPFTTMALGRFGSMVIILLPILLLPTQSDGWLLGLLVVTDAVRFTSRSYRNWVLRRVESGGRRSYEWVILLVLLAGPMAAAAGVAYNAYQADLESMRVRQADRARRAMTVAVADLPVEAVTVAPTGPQRIAVRALAYDDVPDQALLAIYARIEGLLPTLQVGGNVWALTVLTHDSRVEEAVRTALTDRPVQRVTATRALGAEPSRIAITAAGPADDEQARGLGELAQRALLDLGYTEGWQVTVSPGAGPELMDELDINLGAGEPGPP